MRVRREGAYIIKAAEGRSQRVPAKQPPPGCQPPAPTAQDKALARALLAFPSPAVISAPASEKKAA